jgi:hypothetical protein
VVALGCAGWRPHTLQAADPISVDTLAASFPTDDRGSFRVVLGAHGSEGADGRMVRADWEVGVNGRRFGAGTTALSGRLPRTIELTLPVVFHHTGVQPGRVPIAVSLRGDLIVISGPNTLRLPFHGTLSIVSDGAPVFGSGED